MDNRKLLRTGLIGTAIAAVGCFTPLFVVILGFAGLSAWLGWLDYVLFPALGIFILITVYALYRRWKRPGLACRPQPEQSEAT